MRNQNFFPKKPRLDLFKSKMSSLYVPGHFGNLELKLTNFHTVFEQFWHLIFTKKIFPLSTHTPPIFYHFFTYISSIFHPYSANNPSILHLYSIHLIPIFLPFFTHIPSMKISVNHVEFFKRMTPWNDCMERLHEINTEWFHWMTPWN